MRTLLALALAATAACDVADLTSSAPEPPAPRVMFGGATARDVAVDDEWIGIACIARMDGGVRCADIGSPTALLRAIDVPVPIVDVEVSVQHSCALDEDGFAWCWGSNWTGQLGSGNTLSAPDSAVQVIGRDGAPVAFEQIAVAYPATCAVTAAGDLFCWGQYASPGCELCTNLDSVAARVPLAFPVRQVTLGASFLCVIDAGGGVHCWGSNYSGQLGHPSGASTRVDLPEAAIDVAAGGAHACALLESGAIWCWGENWSGTLGRRTNSSGAPGPTSGDIDFAAVDAGVISTCALDADGAVYCWGSDEYGRVRYDDAVAHFTPTLVPRTPRMRAIATASHFACGIVRADDTVQCWGKLDPSTDD